MQKDENQAYPIVSLKKPIGSGASEEFNFKIDFTIGKDTSVTVTYTNDTIPHVSLILPAMWGRGKEIRYDDYKDTGMTHFDSMTHSMTSLRLPWT